MRKLAIRNMALSYGNHSILKGIDFEITQGKITALIGPNGAGKSSAFRVLAGLVQPDSGKVFLDQKELANFNLLKNHCGYLLETADFYPYLSGRKNLELFIGLTNSKANAIDLLEKVGLSQAADKKVQQYSRGMKQRLGLAQVLIDNPSFLILDEPFNGLDPEVKEQILRLLVDLKKQGKGILVSTHLLEDIEAIADDFILLNQGEIYLSGSMESYRTDKQNVTLHFEETVPKDLEIEFDFFSKDHKIGLSASIEETKIVVKKLQELGYIPYKIERSSILYDKYMEIAK
ncbi:ABC transporter ATP-binding protein [Flavobacterium nackdongense]|uniref:ABC transporter ATP-binding protein n=1 Tax=Flavobacterium nackdongense TaxID=2547394 RepID=A0A4P6YF58_9FLAO|nr:ABC transporter ATP-binding protein [Flavobacterium nackdongense]QBN19387.1 ABC transporter ATP-binding protein [Flavobacterium nackdongense]